MSKRYQQNHDYKRDFIQVQENQAVENFCVEQSIDIMPAQLELLDYNDLKSGLNFIRNCLRSSNKATLQKKYEEQYCYFVRELELRQSKAQ